MANLVNHYEKQISLDIFWFPVYLPEEKKSKRKRIHPLDTPIIHFLLTIAISAVPVLELRAGIPYGLGAGLSPATAYCAAVLGNMIPVPFIILLIRKIFDWLRGHTKMGPLSDRLEKKGHVNGRLVQKYRLPGLILLVAIPLPGTGAWTGALAAAMLDIRLKNAIPAILVGVLIAGAIVLGVSLGVIAIAL